MRTTLNLDEDVIDSTKVLVKKAGKSFKFIVNEALRLGLKQFQKSYQKKRYVTHPRQMGLKQGYSLDNIQELLSRLEEEGGS